MPGERRTAYEYDARGRVVRRIRRLLSGGRREWRYAWDGEDRLVRLVEPDGTTWRYLHDPLGRRTAKERLAPDGTPAGRTDFAWDGARVVEELTPETATVWEYAPGMHRPLLQTERRTSGPGETTEHSHLIVTDAAGTPTELLDPAGEIAWERRADLWGAPLAGAATTDTRCRLGFPGQYLDDESGLYYNLRRYYDPDMVRYLSPDPLGPAAGPNHTGYVADPLIDSDPWGLVLAQCMSTELGSALAEANRLNLAGSPRINMVSVARIRGTDIVARGFSGPTGRPAYFEDEVVSALRNGGQMDWDAANCAEIRAVSNLIAENGVDLRHLGDGQNPFREIEFLTVDVQSRLPEAACLSCQSVLVRNGAEDLAPSMPSGWMFS
ncbi:RHS repeat-associated core domain-containing protein [Streptomyces synnematoformans]|uniref:RHS repeat-associated core domain-containing protein n=1 Tax=Streptomyces synnematoformans TaxID=415721 RepID=A0ABN1ZY50_9ACTN